MPEINGSSHSSKNTCGRGCNRLACLANPFEALLEFGDERAPLRFAADDAREHPNHLEDVGDRSLVEGEHRLPALDQLRGDVCLEIGKRKNQIRLKRLDFFESRGDERRDLRFRSRFRRPQRVAGNPDDAMAFAEQVKRLGGLLGQADDALRICRRRRTRPDRRSRRPRSTRDD